MGFFNQGSFTNLSVVGVPGAILAIGVAVIISVGIPGGWIFVLVSLCGGILVAAALFHSQAHKLGAAVVAAICVAGFILFSSEVRFLILAVLLVGSVAAWWRYRRGGKSRISSESSGGAGRDEGLGGRH